MKKAVAFFPDLYESGLDARFDVDHPALVNISVSRGDRIPFEIKLFEESVFDDGHPGLTRLGHIDQYFFGHEKQADLRRDDPSFAQKIGVTLSGATGTVELVSWIPGFGEREESGSNRVLRLDLEEGRSESNRTADVKY